MHNRNDSEDTLNSTSDGDIQVEVGGSVENALHPTDSLFLIKTHSPSSKHVEFTNNNFITSNEENQPSTPTTPKSPKALPQRRDSGHTAMSSPVTVAASTEKRVKRLKKVQKEEKDLNHATFIPLENPKAEKETRRLQFKDQLGEELHQTTFTEKVHYPPTRAAYAMRRRRSSSTGRGNTRGCCVVC